MARVLRNSTKEKTRGSMRKALDARNKLRARPRRERYVRNKGLVSAWIPNKAMKQIAFYNTTTSPLLQLPYEIREVIFRYAMIPSYALINCVYNSSGLFSRSQICTSARQAQLNKVAIHLPQTCRQIYHETATLVYSANAFNFYNARAMWKWLGNRLVAQREAIRYVTLSSHAYKDEYVMEGGKRRKVASALEQNLRLLCPNLVHIEEDLRWGRHALEFSDPSAWEEDSQEEGSESNSDGDGEDDE